MKPRRKLMIGVLGMIAGATAIIWMVKMGRTPEAQTRDNNRRSRVQAAEQSDENSNTSPKARQSDVVELSEEIEDGKPLFDLFA